MSGKSAKKRRRELRAIQHNPDLSQQLVEIEMLRGFVAVEIPDLAGDEPWTDKQLKAIASIYLHHKKDPRWFCPHECGRTVSRFGEQCSSCLRHHGVLGPVDWESVGAE